MYVKEKTLSSVGEEIPFDLGMKMIKDYEDIHNRTIGHFIGRNILLRILEQTDCQGINFFEALNGNKETLVYIGVDSAGDSFGIVADRSSCPCPHEAWNWYES